MAKNMLIKYKLKEKFLKNWKLSAGLSLKTKTNETIPFLVTYSRRRKN
jgi:hypothetical protein